MGVCKAGRTGFPIPRCECSVFHGWTRTSEDGPAGLDPFNAAHVLPAGCRASMHVAFAAASTDAAATAPASSSLILLPRARGDKRPAVVYTSVQSLCFAVQSAC